MNKKVTEITKSTGNVFKDLDLPNPDNCLIKAELAYHIGRLIDKKGLTQEDAAKLLGIDQPKISNLKKGKLTGFSIDRLLKFLITLNQSIEIIIAPQKKKSSHRYQATSHMHVKYANS